jgi:phosphoserine phosphatase
MPPNIDQKLQRFLQKYSHTLSAEKPVAVFDCDDTLIKGDIGESMFYFQLEHFLLRVSPATLWPDHPKHEELGNLYEGLSRLPPEKAVHDRRFISFSELMLDWYFDQLAERKTAKACSDIVRLFTGYSPSEVRQIAHATMKKELEAQQGEWMMGRHRLPKGIRFIQESLWLSRELKSRGFDIWVISGSNRWSVEAVCEHVGIPANHVIGIDLHEEDNVFTSTVKQPVPVLNGKVTALQQHIPNAPKIVVSDSTYDIPLFRYSADLRVLVQPSNGQDFFNAGNVTRDESWVVFETPTPIVNPGD